MEMIGRNIKLVALDLDGTLLDSEKRLSERNRKALCDCAEQGIYVVPTTGRIPDGIMNIMEAVPGIRYSINTNGAMIWDWENKTAIKTCKMDWEKALEVMSLSEGFHVMFDPYVEGRGISEARFMDHLDEYGLTGAVQRDVRSARDVVPSIQEYVRTTKKEVEKVNFFFSDMEDRVRMRELLKGIPDIIVSSSLYNNLEINARGATKGAALSFLADHLSLGISQVMACGDGENDMTMIQAAGIGVAMANGEESIRQAADYVTASNDEDGVALAIERLVFGRG